MSLKKTNNFLKFYSNNQIIVKRLLLSDILANKYINNNLSITINKAIKGNFIKIPNFAFSKTNKNLENMKFEVFKSKDGESKSKSNLDSKASNPTQQAKDKTKSYIAEAKNKLKAEHSNIRFTKHSEANKLKHSVHSSASLTQPRTKAIRKEQILEIKKTKDHQNVSKNFEGVNKNDLDKSENKADSLKLQAQKANASQNLMVNLTETDQATTKDKDNIILTDNESSQNYVESQNKVIQEENLNEAEFELLQQKDKQPYSVDESESFDEDNYSTSESEIPMLLLEEAEKDFLSDQEESQKQYTSLSDILNMYAKDPFYKNYYDSTKRICICEIRYDAFLSEKYFLLLQNCSIVFIVGQFILQGFKLPCIVIYLFIKHFILSFNFDYFQTVKKILADPATMRVDIYTTNFLGMEVCRSYSMFQLVREYGIFDFTAYKFNKDELIHNEYFIDQVCKINNENFFKNFFLIHTKYMDNEYLFKYFNLVFSFNKQNDNKMFDDNIKNQESFFKTIVQEYIVNFPNYLPFLKENIEKDIYNKKKKREYQFRFTFFILIISMINFLLDYYIYKYLICVHHNEVEGGIDTLYENERKNKRG